MDDRRSRLKIGAFLALLALPLAYQAGPAVPGLKLAGEEVPAPLARPTARTWWSGEFQASVDPWLTRRLRAREWLVRIDNQVGLTLFRQAPTSGTPLLLGREGTLFEKAYVDEYNRPRDISPKGVALIVGGLERLDALLRARGSRLIVVVAPGKPEIYPELLPPRHVVPGREGRAGRYEKLVPAIRNSGVALLDARRVLLAERERAKTPLFAKGGTHWNHYANALLAGRLLGLLEREEPGRFVRIQVTGARTDRTVWVTDDDLGSLLNVFWPRPWPGPQTHPVFERRDEGRALPSLLFVGDSFSLQFLEFMTAERLIQPAESLFYFNRRVRYPGGVVEPLDQAAFDARRELAGRDAVVLVMSDYYLAEHGFGFVEAAIADLAAAPGGASAVAAGR